jgi:hypothetical protein
MENLLTEKKPLKKLNNHFKCFFVPKEPEKFNGKRYIPVGLYAIPIYIGQQNGEKLIKVIENLSGDEEVEKYVFKYRKMGKIILYAK